MFSYEFVSFVEAIGFKRKNWFATHFQGEDTRCGHSFRSISCTLVDMLSEAMRQSLCAYPICMNWVTEHLITKTAVASGHVDKFDTVCFRKAMKCRLMQLDITGIRLSSEFEARCSRQIHKQHIRI